MVDTPPMIDPNDIRETKVISNRPISSAAWELVLERSDFSFRAGELISLIGPETDDARDYSIASGEKAETLHILYRLIDHGALTPQLIKLQPGDPLRNCGPYGTFVLRDPDCPILFVATGTGLAPALSFLRSHPGLDLTLLHGVHNAEDLFYRRELVEVCTYYPCVTGEPFRGWQGRVTARLDEIAVNPSSHVYLCGANEMIYEVTDQLLGHGITPGRIFSEPYYYRWES